MFDGDMLAGPVAPHTGGVLATPARMRVERYLKGSGPAVVMVQTAIQPVNDGVVRVTEDGIRPHAGERWRIYASSAREPYATSVCLGSHKLPLRTTHFSANELSFDYPADWHARRYNEVSSFTTWLVWLSPQRMHSPCVTRHGTDNTTINCREPISRLRPDSILASWTTNGFPGWSFTRAPGTRITVGGRRAKWLTQIGTQDAPRLGETEVITVVVPTPGTSDNWYQLTAFLRSPNTVRLQRQIRTMLRSVHWLTPGSAT